LVCTVLVRRLGRHDQGAAHDRHNEAPGEEDMTRTARIGGWLAVAAASVSIWAAQPAAAQPDPPAPVTDATVRVVEIPVPVPVHDRAAEAVQMGLAAALGATLAAGATASRLRRPRTPPGTGLVGPIDITDVVQSRGADR
jgi:hypothetical protein